MRPEVELFFAFLILEGAKNFYGSKWPGTVKAELSNTLEAEGYMPTPESYQEGDYKELK